jgi:hypothetical protein
VFYHGAYPQFLWLQVTMAVALAHIARQCASQPAGSRVQSDSFLPAPVIARP